LSRRKTESDRELLRLLIQELERHVVVFEARPAHPPEAHHALHALKGSAGVAGEPELAAAFERLNRRLKGGDDGAIEQAAVLARTAIDRLRAGDSAIVARWPIPPDDLMASVLDPLARAQYAAEVSDRLMRIDEALATRANPLEAARSIYRHIHSMKGAAGAVGDEPMSWFCHGLEDKLETANSVDAAQAAIHEVAQWRVVLGALLDEPESALGTLRASARASPSTRPAVIKNSASNRPLDSDPPKSLDEGGATIRVPSKDIDRLLERFDEIDLVREGIASRAERSHESAVALRDLRSALTEAVRLIGPPRPWGAPAAALRRVERVIGALAALSDDLDLVSGRLGASERTLRDDVTAGKKQLSGMRQTAVKRIFARLTTAIDSEAHRSGRAVIVRTRGAEETVDRRVAEQLIEPCLQLVRNAVAHGIEPPEVRAKLGKPASGTIALSARKVGNRLSITIEDDGAGVDVAQIRARAVNSGLVTPAVGETADDDTLLWLLFVPGFSTRDSSDLLAGRGIGLEIAQTVTQSMGGAIRLSSRAGEGFSAHLDVPIESGVVSVLWVTAGENEFAIPSANARQVRRNEGPDAMRVPHLLSCLDAAVSERASYVVDLDLPDDDDSQPPVAIGVDGVKRTEDALVRRLGPLIAGLGPFAGAIVRGDGSLRLAIDPWAVAPRARAYTAAQVDGHPNLTVR
jgi:two-component system chemotaxis sensor kinase CheA